MNRTSHDSIFPQRYDDDCMWCWCYNKTLGDPRKGEYTDIRFVVCACIKISYICYINKEKSYQWFLKMKNHTILNRGRMDWRWGLKSISQVRNKSLIAPGIKVWCIGLHRERRLPKPYIGVNIDCNLFFIISTLKLSVKKCLSLEPLARVNSIDLNSNIWYSYWYF